MNASPHIRRFGLPGFIGAFLLSLSAWLHHFWVPGQEGQLAQMESMNRRARHELNEEASQRLKTRETDEDGGAGSALAGATNVRGLWTIAWARLPQDTSRLALQEEVFTSAAASGMGVAGAQMGGAWEPWLPATSPQGLWRQRIAMPVKGSHASLRAWVGRLQRLPAVTIDSIEMQRADLLSGEVRARVSLSLWWRQERAQP